MKMVKSLLLGTAAGLVAMAGAQAADLPEETQMKPVKGISPGGGTGGIIKETGGITGTEESG